MAKKPVISIYDEKYTMPGGYPLGPNASLDHEICVGSFELPEEYSGNPTDGSNPSIGNNLQFPPRS